MNENSCPIWGTTAQTGQFEGRDGIAVDSPRAGGRYFISGTADVTIGDEDDAFKAKLTTWLIDQRGLGVACPEISTHTFEEVKVRPALSVIERGERVLHCLSKMLPTIGEIFKLEPTGAHEGLLAFSESVKMKEVTYLLDHLVKRELLEESPYTYGDLLSDGGGFGDGSLSQMKPADVLPPSLVPYREFGITPLGYAHLNEVATQVAKVEQAFVAMWFDSSMDEVYEKAVSPALVEAGYSPMRIDKKDHNNKIDDEIVAEIKRSAFVVSDFTHGEKGMRGGVYYEAGLAHGLGLPVIFTCRDDLLDEIHFDTRQYNHLSWKPDQLDAFRTALVNRISATIGDGPLKGQE